MEAPPVVRARRGNGPVWIIAGAVVLLAFGCLFWLAARPGGSSVRRVAHADADLQAASRRAQAELDSFVAQLAAPKRGERFAVKGAFDTPDGPEYLWVKDPTYRSGKFEGILDQPPIAFVGAHKGDPVTVSRDKVFDWLIKDGDKTQGGYTERVLSSRNSGQ